MFKVAPGMYRHYKGGIYQVLNVAKHTETNESLVIYENAAREWFARPASMFQSKVVVDGKEMLRFTPLAVKNAADYETYKKPKFDAIDASFARELARERFVIKPHSDVDRLHSNLSTDLAQNIMRGKFATL